MNNVITILIILAGFIFGVCGDAKIDSGHNKEQSNMFDTDGVPYPVQFANYQRNSFVPIELNSAGKLAWTREYLDFDQTLLLMPLSVQISGDLIGVRSTKDLLIFATNGDFQDQIEIGENKPVVFGKSAFAYTKPSFQLEYRKFDGELILEEKGFPALREYSKLLLLKPSEDDFTAAIEYSGGPQRRPREYYIYRIGLEQTLPAWGFGSEGKLDHILMRSDNITMIIIRGNEVTLLNTDNGKTNGSFKTSMNEIESASIDHENNLVLIGKETSGKITRSYLKVVTLKGEQNWSYILRQPSIHQPPVCGKNGQIYIVDSMRVKCFSEGEEIWSLGLRSEQPAWLTTTADNKLICLNGGFLSVHDSEGNLIFDLVLASDGETFDAPVALDSNGRLYVAGGQKLYCFE